MTQPKTALLLMDVQASFPARDYWVETLAQAWRPKQRAVLNAAQANDIPIVRILHEEPGSQGAFDPDNDLIRPLDDFNVDERLHRVQDAICAAPSQTWRVETLAAHGCMSERHFRRQFKSLIGMLVGDYIMGLRLQRAKALMTETTWTLERIAEASGFGDERQLRRIWARQEKAPPSVWRRSQLS